MLLIIFLTIVTKSSYTINEFLEVKNYSFFVLELQHLKENTNATRGIIKFN